MTELHMSNKNNNNHHHATFWGSAISAWAGFTIAAQVAIAMPPQQQQQHYFPSGTYLGTYISNNRTFQRDSN
jgi:hypothetical protein